MKSVFALSVAAVVVLAGCSAPAPASEPVATVAPTTEAPQVLKPGSYSFENSTGAKGTLDVPGKPAADVEALRALVKAPAKTYLTVHVDNRAGSVGVNMYRVSIFTPAGEELEYVGASEYIDSIRPSDAPAETYNQFINTGNKHNEMANPKGVRDFVMVGPKVPAEFTSVTVYPTGAGDPVEAAPAS
jgi:hypothetical protein